MAPKIFDLGDYMVAVFGMRFLFPVLVVAIFAQISLLEVVKIALSDAHKYTYYLHQTHASIDNFWRAHF